MVGSKAQTLLKAEVGDHAPAGRKKALVQSLSKSLPMLETCQKSPRLLVAPQFQFGSECSLFTGQLEHSRRSPLKGQVEFVEQAEHVTQRSKCWGPLCVVLETVAL